MPNLKILSALTLLCLAILACGVDLTLPETVVVTGPTIEENIAIENPDYPEADLTLILGAGELNIGPGADGKLVEGTFQYNVADLKPIVTTTGNNVEIKIGDFDLDALPTFDEDIKNQWDLRLTDTPLFLRIKAGAYLGVFELGGLELTGLVIEDGAADVEVNFEEPNPVEMAILDYQTGASSVTLRNLANANFTTMVFASGAGDYTLDFSGNLQRDATVKIETGLSNFEIVVPQGTAAVVRIEEGLSNTSIRGSWVEAGNEYRMEGDGPTLTISIDIGAGNLVLSDQ